VTGPPPGWYPDDPSNPQREFWWSGEGWTGASRPVHKRDYGPNNARIKLYALLVIIGFVVWFIIYAH
jgi:hypothetical protein